MTPKERFEADFQNLLASRTTGNRIDYYSFDRTGLTELELLDYDKRLFKEYWYGLSEDLVLGFQWSAHPATAKFIFDETIAAKFEEFDYKPLSRKCIWALADIGTDEAKRYLETIAGLNDKVLTGFARKRLNNWEQEQARKGRKIPSTGYHDWRINLEPYADYQARLPASGRHIIAYQTQKDIVSYQAYKPVIADYAVEHQQFGGLAFSYNRMSWVKPNFLWMMYRCGWAEKENQERVLAIYISKTDWEEILSQAVFSSFQADVYGTKAEWKARLSASAVRLQWDPDHSPYGGKLERKAVQIGMKGDILRRFGTEMVRKIVDVTPFVKSQKLYVDRRDLANLEIPKETVYEAKRRDLLPDIGL